MSSVRMDILSDLAQYLSCDEESMVCVFVYCLCCITLNPLTWLQMQAPQPAVTNSVENYYKLRFEAAETRYTRLKTLVNVSLEKQAMLQAELKTFEISNLMVDLQIGAAEEGSAVLWNTLTELKAAREEIQKLTEMNHCLQNERPMKIPSIIVLRDACVEGELQAARRQISALDLELVRMSDQQFEIEERVREYQDVIDHLLGNEQVVPEPVHPRYHPIAEGSSAACQNYIKRLRNGLRQAVADAYVRDRRVRLHGYFQQVVRPQEELIAEKNQRIRELLLRLARLECATLRSAEDVSTVDETKARLVAETEQLKWDIERMHSECDALRERKDRLTTELQGLQAEIEEARLTIDESSEKRILCKAEMQRLENERERAEQVWERIQRFLGGQTGAEFEKMQREYQRLEHELEILQLSVQETKDSKEKEKQEHSSVKRIDGVVFIQCRCGQSVSAEEIGQHITDTHEAQYEGNLLQCPRGCGFFAVNVKEMSSHLYDPLCLDKVNAIKRLKASPP